MFKLQLSKQWLLRDSRYIAMTENVVVNRIQALMVRLLLFLHFLLVLWRVSVAWGEMRWLLACAIVPFLLETVLNICKWKGIEWKWWVVHEPYDMQRRASHIVQGQQLVFLIRPLLDLLESLFDCGPPINLTISWQSSSSFASTASSSVQFNGAHCIKPSLAS